MLFTLLMLASSSFHLTFSFPLITNQSTDTTAPWTVPEYLCCPAEAPWSFCDFGTCDGVTTHNAKPYVRMPVLDVSHPDPAKVNTTSDVTSAEEAWEYICCTLEASNDMVCRDLGFALKCNVQEPYGYFLVSQEDVAGNGNGGREDPSII